MPENTEKRARRWLFAASFAITLLIIVPVFLAVYYFEVAQYLVFGKTDTVGAESSEPVPVLADDYELLFAVCTDDGGEPLCAAAIRFDPQTRSVKARCVPRAVLLAASGHAEGINPGTSASRTAANLGEKLGTEFDGYYFAPLSQLTKLVDEFGGFEFAVTQPLTAVNASGDTEFSVAAGSAVFYGGMTANMLKYGWALDDDGYDELAKRMLRSALSEYAGDTFSVHLTEAYFATVDCCETDINSASVGTLARSAQAACASDSDVVCTLYSPES